MRGDSTAWNLARTTICEAMLTLFMAISGGIDWDDALIPLRNLDDVASTAAVTALILYIVITVPGIRNNAC